MARTESEIKQIINDSIAADPGVSSLTTNTSATAIWRLFTNVFVRSIQVFEALFDLYKADVQSIVDSMRPGDELWVAQKAKEYQHGSNLSIVDGKPAYTTVIPANRIVTQVAVANRFGQVWVKIVKGATRTALTHSELSGFTSYMNKVMFAGVETICISQASDKIKLKVDVYGNASTLDALKVSVPEVLRSFFPALQLDGSFQLTDLESLLKQLEGCSDAIVYEVEHQWQGESVWYPVARRVSPVSGWFEFAAGWDIDTPGININYYQQ